MFSSKLSACSMMLLPVAALVLTACGQHGDAPDENKVEIKPAPVMTNDATEYARQAWILINQVDPLLYAGQKDQLQAAVRDPVRQLSTDWRINVKMTDSVTEGKYALCRKALTSIDSWARAVIENDGQLAQRQASYERDKAQCQSAIEQPELGNTKAYNKLF